MKNLLLTGSSGFIGQYFFQNYASKYNIKTFSFLNDSFELLKLEEIDTVIHLSALVHQMGGATKEEYYKVNVNQTVALAKRAKRRGVLHFIFMSSVKVYGEETDTPYTEQSKCLPQDDYGKSKLMAEEELKLLEDDDFRVSIIRTPIVYGYGVKANIKNLIHLVDKVPILPFGDINNRRSMVYIGNLCYLIDCVVQQSKRGVFLASDDETYSTKKLILLIAEKLNKRVFLLKIPFFKKILKIAKPSFYKRLYESLEIDNQWSKRELKLDNPYSFEDGIDLTMNLSN